VGLCFGGGQLFPGSLGTVFGVAVLTVLRSVEVFISREHRALLIVKASTQLDVQDLVLPILSKSGVEAKLVSAKYSLDDGEAELCTFNGRRERSLGEPYPVNSGSLQDGSYGRCSGH
jgi:hypothetical protein